MQLFYFPTVMGDLETIELRGDEVHHITKVLRHNPGDQIHFTNGIGSLFKAELTQVSGKSLICRLTESKNYTKPYFSSITLAIGIIKLRDRLEFAIEKAVEIGVGRIVLFDADRSERSNIKESRVLGIIEAAMKQSLQVYLPELVVLGSVDEVLKQDYGRTIVAHEQVQYSHQIGQLSSDDPVVLFVGPEGGFSEREVNLLTEKSATFIGLGDNRLRAETASLVFLSQMHKKFVENNSATGVQLYR
ncbi:MAG TPA: 16S rRNA (uracil(1498)-N(3))-methyltransferase [Bacteroidetes bacterium]|nr:16S rRNA (uracil(1498)-N(3))-methyltransferase [Bacteroidota bacterium]